jgi:hypothetical protein
MKKMKKRLPEPKYEYQILVNKRVVWHGIAAKEKLTGLAKKIPLTLFNFML